MEPLKFIACILFVCILVVVGCAMLGVPAEANTSTGSNTLAGTTSSVLNSAARLTK